MLNLFEILDRTGMFSTVSVNIPESSGIEAEKWETGCFIFYINLEAGQL
jgi:hypothetical protein